MLWGCIECVAISGKLGFMSATWHLSDIQVMIEQHLFHLEVFRILAEDFVIMTNATDLEPRPRTVVKAKPIAACP